MRENRCQQKNKVSVNFFFPRRRFFPYSHSLFKIRNGIIMLRFLFFALFFSSMTTTTRSRKTSSQIYEWDDLIKIASKVRKGFFFCFVLQKIRKNIFYVEGRTYGKKRDVFPSSGGHVFACVCVCACLCVRVFAY